ncbi:Imm26 family immunity protein [Capnocytophaga sp.]|uniref:Imm26 family immunity protein n=1 Tax=Capnocytophaga sp. TaxID=44737 RepID=UPI0026DBA800|nr:Imm26 family immunity protein [Capnocytophaga sp.]MDO5106075.1 Imm26 family immunity protein [Capnocytophaga sp.]
MNSKITLWGWEKKPRTMLRYIKAGDIVCFEIDKTGTRFGYGQLIAHLSTGGFVFKAMNVTHSNPNDITIDEIIHSDTFGKPCVLDVYSTLDRKKYIQNGEWRIIGTEHNFNIKTEDLQTIFFVYGIKGFHKKINLLNEETAISDEEAEKYLDAGLNTGDQVKMWFVKYTD